MPLEKMGKENQAKIARAMDDVATFVAGGMKPNEAIAKAAQQNSIERGHIRLLVQGYNIGESHRHFKEGATLEERAADFPIADYEGVLGLLYTDKGTRKSASVPPIAEVYLRPATPTLRTVKAAARITPETPRPTAPPDLIANRQKRARRVDEMRRVVSAGRDQFRSGVFRLAEALEQPGMPKVAAFVNNISLLHGDAGLSILKAAQSLSPALTKQAGATRAFHRVSEYPQVYGAVERLIKLAADIEAATNLHADMAKAAAALDRRERLPYLKEPKNLLDQLDFEAEKQAGLHDAFDSSLANLNELVEPSDVSNPAVDKRMRQIGTPDHEQQLRAIEARTMLHNLFNHDEILRSHDPFEIARHYNRLSQMVPDLAMQPLVTVPATRKAVQQGHLDHFDVKEIADINQKLDRSKKPGDGVKVAAALLAEAYVAGRAQRLTKQADPWQSLQQYAGQAKNYLMNPANAHITGGIGGAAAGGLYGYMAGDRSERERSPWTSAMRGALSGGLLGASGGLGYQAMTHQGLGGELGNAISELRTPSAPPPGLEAYQADVAKNRPTLARFADKLTGAGTEDTSLAAILGEGLSRNVAPDMYSRALFGTGLVAGTGNALRGARRWKRQDLQQELEHFQRGAEEMVSKHQPNQQGVMPASPYHAADMSQLTSLLRRAGQLDHGNVKTQQAFIRELRSHAIATPGGAPANPAIAAAFLKGRPTARPGAAPGAPIGLLGGMFPAFNGTRFARGTGNFLTGFLAPYALDSAASFGKGFVNDWRQGAPK